MDLSVTDGTTLENLLALQLHLFEDEVRNIVDEAVKEMAIEKVLLHLKDCSQISRKRKSMRQLY